MIPLYMDENVFGAITRGLRLRRIDVLTVQEDGKEGLSDPAVLDRAGELGRLLFSQNQDLLREATQRQKAGKPFVGVVYAHQDKAAIGKCIEDLEFIAQAGLPEDFANRVEYLPLR